MQSSQIRAAQYLRSSKLSQLNSIELQAEAIQRYALEHGFAIVRTYADLGKSGLSAKERQGLNGLLRDVMGGQASFQAVLVYDVSRWGRFQDADESAHYEFLCKQAGIEVHYCMEDFTNDRSARGTIWKGIRRAMVADYSRKLSDKVFLGQKLLVGRGFRMGSQPGYGLRRMAISSDGSRKTVLEAGDRKYLATDRVILVPGPENEVQRVRWIFNEVMQRRKGPTEIARKLNELGIDYRNGKPWQGWHVERVLHNPKYAGCLVWNRTTRRLRSPQRPLARELWVVKEGASVPIIDPSIFERAQQVLPKKQRWTDEVLLSKARSLLARQGSLTAHLITATKGMPCSATYIRRFNGLRNFYDKLDYPADAQRFAKDQHRKPLLLLRDILVGKLRELFGDTINIVYRPKNMRPLIRFDEETYVSVRICRCQHRESGSLRWRFFCGVRQQEHLALVCLLNKTNSKFYRYYLIPPPNVPGKSVGLRKNDPILRSGVRLNNLAHLRGAMQSFVDRKNGSQYGR